MRLSHRAPLSRLQLDLGEYASIICPAISAAVQARDAACIVAGAHHAAQARAFDRGVRRLIVPGLEALIGYQGTAVSAFERAMSYGVPRVLDYPIAHYDVCERLLS